MSPVRRKVSLLAAGALSAGLIAGGSAATADAAHTKQSGVGPARAVGVLHQAKRALAGKSNRDVTTTLARLAVVAHRLTGPQAAQANGLLARPTSDFDPQQHKYRVKEHVPPYCTAHFCVHWVDKTDDAPSLKDSNLNGVPDYVEETGAVTEQVYQAENKRLGWTKPKPDGNLGGDSKTDVYLAELGNEGLYGYTAVDPKQGGRGAPPRSEHAYLVMDQNFSRTEFHASPELSLEVTLAHEYNHVLQYTYDLYQDGWAAESTATWMEDRVFPAANDYFQYLPSWVRRTSVPLTLFTNAKVYGSAVWNHWLAARYGPAVIRDTWRGAVKIRPAGFSPDAYGAAIRNAGGSTFQRDFARFAVDTAEWRANGRFPEGSRYPTVKRSGSLRPGRSTTRKVNHTSYRLIDVKAPKGSPSVRLGVNVPAGVDAAVALVGRTRGGSRVVVRKRFLRNGGQRSVALGQPSRYARITAVIVNTDISQNGYNGFIGDWRFTHDHIPFRVSLK